jgi:hypothetical protein
MQAGGCKFVRVALTHDENFNDATNCATDMSYDRIV